MRKLSSINFKYAYRLHFVVVIRIYFEKKINLPQSTNSKNPSQIKNIFTSSQLTEYVQNQGSYQIQKGIYKFLLSFFFLYNFKLKMEALIDCKLLLVIFPFKNLCIFTRIHFFCIREND